MFNELLGKDYDTVKYMMDPYKKWRTLYFDNNIDIRLCPKNANTTLKHIYSQLHLNQDINITTHQRCLLYQNQLIANTIDRDSKFLFRKKSYKIAIKRNPIERALSSAKYIFKTKLNIEDPDIELVEEMLLEVNHKNDFHFLPQAFFMGTPEMYNAVYDIHSLDNMIEYLSEYKWNGKITLSDKNVSESKIQISDLSDEVINRWKQIFKIDYELGWC